MILLSSIVKAKMLTNVPPAPVDKGKAPQEIDSTEIEKTSIGEVNEKSLFSGRLSRRQGI